MTCAVLPGQARARSQDPGDLSRGPATSILRAVAEIQFLDGKKVVDDIYVGPINRVTNGHPERLHFRTVMTSLGAEFEREFLRDAQRTIVRDHLAQHGE